MSEFDSVSVSTFEASTLVAKLSEKSGEGWDVVAIVPTGSDITAFLKRESAPSTSSTTSGWESTAAESQPAASTPSTSGAASTPTEPAGWSSAPAASGASGLGSSDQGGGSSWGSGSSTPAAGGAAWGPSSQSSSAPSAPAAAPSTPSVPAGWYSDPAGRFELRYWDGSAWTEHVSRAGQQYTDPPVA
jgi:hypothetical protein